MYNKKNLFFNKGRSEKENLFAELKDFFSLYKEIVNKNK